MKKSLLFAILMVSFIRGYNQTQITLTFTGKDSVSQTPVPIDSVLVYNVDEQCDTLLHGPEPVFLLMANWPVGIIGAGPGSQESLILKQNYPNPFQGSTRVSVYKGYQGTLKFALYDGLGTVLAASQNELHEGFHTYSVSSLGNRMLSLVVSDGRNSRSVKIVSSGQQGEGSTIRYLGPTGPFEKSIHAMTVDPGFIFYLGNQLKYTAYANGYLDNTMYDSPTVNTTYTFNLAPLNTDEIPTVTTSPVTNVTQTSATTGGTVTSDGGASVTARGVCWSTSANPTTADPHTVNGGGTGTFVSQISSLDPNTLYYVRAYATNSVGTAYGMELNFTTLPVSLPSVTTTPIVYIASTSATGGGNVTSDGGAYVTTRGVCWSTSSNPTTADAHTIDGSGTGTFVSLITSLIPNTTYHVRAYATNSIGTSYGGELVFTTLPPSIPVVITNGVTYIGPTVATCGGNVTSDGGATVTARGVCWSTTTNPTTANPHTIDGGGTGTFVSSITGLTPNTLYYVRSYATNSVGTAYGNEVNFITLLPGAHYIGENFGGGIIFYLDGSLQHGLIAAASDQSTGAEWGCFGTFNGGTNFGFGTGQANTTAIVNGCSQAGIAARVCDALVLNGYSDWYLPSTNELWELWDQQWIVGGFANDHYWSSSEYDANTASAVSFPDWDDDSAGKNGIFHVRAIRSF